MTKRLLAAEVAWLVKQLEGDTDRLLELEVLTEEPTREKFFAMLHDLDYEVKGGDCDNPRWAYEEHPWYEYLEITKEECEAYWDRRNASG